MSTQKFHFQFEDFVDVGELPAPGFYPSNIKSAIFRQSAKQNLMLKVVHALECGESAHQQTQIVCDYFVVEGDNVSQSGINYGRRRLLQLYYACGIFPKEDEEISADQLLHAHLEVRVEHEQWKGRPWLRIVDYRPLQSFDSDDRIPF